VYSEGYKELRPMEKPGDTPSIAEIRYLADSRPLTRWWWFAEKIKKTEIDAQLDWVQAKGFGGVEIAWVYAGKRFGPVAPFLGPEWQELVAYAKRACEQRNLACDFTFGTLWPFGGSMVSEANASKRYDGLSPQRLRRSWESAHGLPPAYLMDHLDRNALEEYAAAMGAGLAPALDGELSALFCDSWEIDPEGLWTRGFGEAFENEFGYDLRPYMPVLSDHPNERYDYRWMRAVYALREFYEAYTEICHRLGGLSRVQAHGAPTDLLAAYAAADIPESEALLFDPQFSTFAASAAALTGKQLVTTEAFTCLYGWVPHPERGPHIKEEQPADLKYLADALFANGVNHIIWHGMPFNPPGESNEFYATVHVGPDAGFAGELPELNAYMERVSAAMKRGETHAQLAVYSPHEDTMMAGELPEGLRRPSAAFHWEMHYARFPQELQGYRPIWTSEHFLNEATVRNGRIVFGGTAVEALLADVEYMEYSALSEIARLVGLGARVFLPREPRRPGTRPAPEYDELLASLRRAETVAKAQPSPETMQPMVAGREIPEFWCRQDGDEHIFFFAHPKASRISYPMEFGQSHTRETVRREVTISVGNTQVDTTLEFPPYHSLLLTVSNGRVVHEELDYCPSEPLLVGS
jgi:hypothetical protein